MPSIPFPGLDGKLWDFAHAAPLMARQHVPSNEATSVGPTTNEMFNSTYLMRQQSGLGSFQSVNASAILELNQRHTLQVVVTVNASISLFAAMFAIYWFCMMRRNFRRDLVLLLILGGAWKTLWFLIFSAVSWTRGPVSTETVFCQASGYMLQVGFEACDLAIMFMSMHMYLQIFPPSHSSILGHEGLYRVRRWVFAVWFILPNVDVALAFVNSRAAFMAQGGFCNLPVRPIWYRLALAWIPRYLIWIYTVFVAIRIYKYVGSEFKVFGHERDRSSSMGMPGESSIDRAAQAEQERTLEKVRSPRDQSPKKSQRNIDDDSVAPDDVSAISRVRTQQASTDDAMKSPPTIASRRQSTPMWSTGLNGFNVEPLAPSSRSLGGSRRGSRQIAIGVLAEDFAPLSLFDRTHKSSVASVASRHSSAAASLDALAPIQEGPNASLDSRGVRNTASYTLMRRRRAIQRQLRLLFIYPCVYMMCFLFPFIAHCMNYSDYFAQHPVFPISVLNFFSLTIMSLCDVLIFSWRERPWRHIPGSDGTFLGSFMWWRFCFKSDWAEGRRESRVPSFGADEKQSQHDGHGQAQGGFWAPLRKLSVSLKLSSNRSSDSSAATRMTPVHKRTYSGGSDRRHLEAERAYERLALERAEYEKNRHSLHERRSSVIAEQQQQHLPVRKEWFEMQLDTLASTDTKLNMSEGEARSKLAE